MRLTETGSDEDVAQLVRKAYDAGINLFDTSRKTPESEKLLGDALYDIRRNVFLSTTTDAKTSDEIRQSLETSLMTLHCDNVDLFQLETEKFLPLPGGADKIYDTLMALKKEKKTGHIGIVTTSFETAKKAVLSDCYETLQFPFSMISPDDTIELVKLCEEHDVGLIENIPLAFGFLHQYESVLPIWGVKNQEELNHILYFNEHPPVIDEKFKEDVEKIRMFFN